MNDRSPGTGFLELEHGSIDSYPCNGYCLRDIESKFISAGTVLAAERFLLTARGVKMSESSGIANFTSLSMLKLSLGATVPIGCIHCKASIHVCESFTKLGL